MVTWYNCVTCVILYILNIILIHEMNIQHAYMKAFGIYFNLNSYFKVFSNAKLIPKFQKIGDSSRGLYTKG